MRKKRKSKYNLQKRKDKKRNERRKKLNFQEKYYFLSLKEGRKKQREKK